MKMKKNYITPQIAVFTCNSEGLLVGISNTEVTDNSGGKCTVEDLGGNTPKTGDSSELSKFNSGMSWDEEE